MKRLHLLLAPKERFEPEGAGAFALNVLETTRASRWCAGITVFGSPVARPFADVGFQPLTTSRWSLPNHNVAFARRYADSIKHALPDLIEIFNRPVMVKTIRQRIGSVPITVQFGNDPRGMDGSRTVAERLSLLTRTNAVICVSNFIGGCFLDGLGDTPRERVHVIPTGVEWSAEFPEAKEKQIVFVGRIAPEKGVLELVQALVRVLPQHPTWTARIIGAKWFGKSTALSPYENEVLRVTRRCERIVAEGFLPHDDAVAALREASIAVVPSCWDEPGHPRTADEALAQGAALICSKRGGIPEIGDDRAMFLDDISADTLAAALERLISNDGERHALQRRGWEGFPFDIRRTTQKLDDLRARLMGEL